MKTTNPLRIPTRARFAFKSWEAFSFSCTSSARQLFMNSICFWAEKLSVFTMFHSWAGCRKLPSYRLSFSLSWLTDSQGIVPYPWNWEKTLIMSSFSTSIWCRTKNTFLWVVSRAYQKLYAACMNYSSAKSHTSPLHFCVLFNDPKL